MDIDLVLNAETDARAYVEKVTQQAQSPVFPAGGEVIAIQNCEVATRHTKS